jgi:hypothetical protein
VHQDFEWRGCSGDDGEDTSVTHREKSLQAMSIKKKWQISPSLAWADHDALRDLAAFPFVLGMDETDEPTA